MRQLTHLDALMVVTCLLLHMLHLFRSPFDEGSRHALVDFTLVAWALHIFMRRTLLPRMGYNEALTNIQ